MAPNGSLDAALRAAVRKELEWEGFAMLAPGVLAHPAADPAGVAEVLQRLDAAGRVFVCRATELAGVGARPLAELVREGWDLSGVTAGYARFIADFTPLLAALQTATDLAPQQAFVMRSLLVHAYRRVQLHDPMLPLALLPQPWPGSAAYELARAIYRLVSDPAEQHLMAVLRREDTAAPPADAAFHARFDGVHRDGASV
jgi:phenylacetic acid degradation operon negative regulatory protein